MAPSSSLIGWFDDQLSRMQDDLFRNQFFDMPHLARVPFDPHRRSRLFDAMFANDAFDVQPTFHENPNKQQIECQLNTGCGDFFRPEDIEVNVKGRNVEFRARREEKSEDGHNYTVREVRRMFPVPEGADMEKLNAEMGTNGKVLLTAPLTKPAIENKQQKKGPVPIKINRTS